MAEPARPRIVLRIAVAGNRKIEPESATGLSSQIDEILSAIEAAITSLPPYRGTDRGVAYSTQTPAVRLISGLADGSDQIACEAFLASGTADVERSIAAVLPFDVDTYRDRSRIANVARFEKQLAACRYVLELDGRYAEGDAAAARRARAAAYRAQAEMLLRQADILFAIEDPRAPAQAGGTRETIARALHLGVPVIYVPLSEETTAVLRSNDDLDGRDPDADWHTDIASIVRAILADPRTAPVAEPSQAPAEERDLHDRRQYEDELVDEFFTTGIPPRSFRQGRWSSFEKRFRDGGSGASDVIPEAFRDWRARASALSAHYAGLYRGTFLLNYSLAVTAVCLAVAALVVLILFPHAHDYGHWPWFALAAFGVGKVFVVVTIQRLTNQANRNRWNDKAVDYRYLAERLRSMAYLPHIGSLRALSSGSAGYATRVSTRSVIDWLFQAMVRHVSLDEVTPPAAEGRPIASDPRAAAVAIRDGWIANQTRYHASNAATMGRMSEGLEKAGRAMNVAVIYVVCADLAILLLTGLDVLPAIFSGSLLYLSPWLLFFAAVLPAAVASLNGIRFQSECARLADRSIQMERMLAVLKTRADATIGRIDDSREVAAIRPGHVIDVLHLAEDCAKLTLDEVAEWSFVYAKEIVEP